MVGGDKTNKKTQGHSKQTLIFSDLLNNKDFMAEVKRISNLPPRKRKIPSMRLAEQHRLLYCFGTPLYQLINLGYFSHRGLRILDMCRINGDYFEHSGECLPTYKTYKIPATHFYQTHPVSIGISPNASQRDVIDFIKKQWKDISLNLQAFEARPKRIRKRTKLQRDNFIWSLYKKGLTAQEILDLTYKDFYSEQLGLEHIHAIISQERDRRSEK
jgi:hypothetical protein